MELKLKTCSVRSWDWRDRDAIVKHANNRNVWINLRDRFPHPYTVNDARRWLDMVVGQEPETNFAIAVADEAVGGIGFTVQHDVARRSAEIGYWLGEEFWGRGIGTEALIAVTDYAFFKLRCLPFIRARVRLEPCLRASAGKGRVRVRRAYEKECDEGWTDGRSANVCDDRD